MTSDFTEKKWLEGLTMAGVLGRMALGSFALAGTYFAYLYASFAVGYYREDMIDLAKLAKSKLWQLLTLPYRIATDIWSFLLPIKLRIGEFMGLFVSNYFEYVDSFLYKNPSNVPSKHAFNGAFTLLTHWCIPFITLSAVAMVGLFVLDSTLEYIFPVAIPALKRKVVVLAHQAYDAWMHKFLNVDGSVLEQDTLNSMGIPTTYT